MRTHLDFVDYIKLIKCDNNNYNFVLVRMSTKLLNYLLLLI